MTQLSQIPSVSWTQIGIGVGIVLAIFAIIILFNKVDDIISQRWVRRSEFDGLKKEFVEVRAIVTTLQTSTATASEQRSIKLSEKMDAILELLSSLAEKRKRTHD